MGARFSKKPTSYNVTIEIRKIRILYGVAHHWIVIINYGGNRFICTDWWGEVRFKYKKGCWYNTNNSIRLFDDERYNIGEKFSTLKRWTNVEISTGPAVWERWAKKRGRQKFYEKNYGLFDNNCQNYCEEFVTYLFGYKPRDFPLLETEKAFQPWKRFNCCCLPR